MLKKTIKYEDFNGETVVEDFYFHLTKMELLELDAEYKGGFVEAMQRAAAEDNRYEIIQLMKKFILRSYGVKSPDGKRHIKNDEVRREFESTAAYEALFEEFVEDVPSFGIFIQGIVPSNLGAKIAELARSNGSPGPELGDPAAPEVESRRSVVPQRVSRKTLTEMGENEFHAIMERAKKGEVEIID